ncbi:phage holin family protein [Uliginosibacterium sediminicola]|jgi:uncharacterized membrane protein YqjE|uniref:Phage holin family protein n=1 Tax=Uliginosibacterium sediminicola TaxID=2024550 RepID=A0ABU9Z1X2_9RHOO
MGSGLSERLRRLLGHAAALAATRVDLFGLELQEELERQIKHLALLLGVLLCAALAAIFGAVLVLVLAWHSGHLLAAATALMLCFAALALAGFVVLRRCLQRAPTPFAVTLEEFQRDAESMRTARESDS